MTDIRVMLKGRREFLGLSQTAAAAKASVSESDWSDYESGARPLTDARLAELSTGIGFRPRKAAKQYWEQIVQTCAAYKATALKLRRCRPSEDTFYDLELVVDYDWDMSGYSVMSPYDIVALEFKLAELCSVSFDIIHIDWRDLQKAAAEELETEPVAGRDQDVLEDLLGVWNLAREQVLPHGKAAYDSDPVLQRLAQGLCIAMGDAASRLSPRMVAAHPLMFKYMEARGDEVANNFRSPDLERIWRIIATEFPAEKAKIAALHDSTFEEGYWEQD